MICLLYAYFGKLPLDYVFEAEQTNKRRKTVPRQNWQRWLL